MSACWQQNAAQRRCPPATLRRHEQAQHRRAGRRRAAKEGGGGHPQGDQFVCGFPVLAFELQLLENSKAPLAIVISLPRPGGVGGDTRAQRAVQQMLKEHTVADDDDGACPKCYIFGTREGSPPLTHATAASAAWLQIAGSGRAAPAPSPSHSADATCRPRFQPLKNRRRGSGRRRRSAGGARRRA